MKKSIQIKIWLIRSVLKITSLISVKWCASIAFRIFTTPFRKGSSYKPPVFEKAEEINLQVNGVKIIGYRWNPNSSKKILIVHGFESRSFNFYRYIDILVEKGFSVYAMDAKAHGNSEGKTIILPEYTAMFRELEKKYGVFDGYICHSFGGIAVCLYEEEFNHPSSKLILIAPATETATAIKMFCTFFNLSDKVMFAMHDLIEQRSGNKIDHYSIKRIVKKINNPIYWIHDEGDDITPLSDVNEIISNKPDHIRFYITKGLGHRKIYKDPETLKRVIDFIEF
jgi:pimeloyl-ACP methyl ester carboxylesterase